MSRLGGDGMRPFGGPDRLQYNPRRTKRNMPGSWESENVRFAQGHGPTVCRYQVRIGTHNPEVTGHRSCPRYLKRRP